MYRADFMLAPAWSQDVVVRGVGSRKVVERPLQKVCARSARDFANLINIHWWRHHFVILLIIIACRTSTNALFFTLHTPHATKRRCLIIFIVFGSPHLSRRGYNNNEYYYDRRKSAAAMAYLAAAAPTPLVVPTMTNCFSLIIIVKN